MQLACVNWKHGLRLLLIPTGPGPIEPSNQCPEASLRGLTRLPACHPLLRQQDPITRNGARRIVLVEKLSPHICCVYHLPPVVCIIGDRGGGVVKPRPILKSIQPACRRIPGPLTSTAFAARLRHHRVFEMANRGAWPNPLTASAIIFRLPYPDDLSCA